MFDYQKTFGKTYKFFPTYENYPAPDACHTILGLLTCLVLPSVYLAYFFDGHTITLYSTFFGIIIGFILVSFFGLIIMLSNKNNISNL